MPLIGIIKRIIPFLLTFAAGLFVASFFVSLWTPSFGRGTGGGRHECRRVRHENSELRIENERLKQEYFERLADSVPAIDLESGQLSPHPATNRGGGAGHGNGTAP